MLLSIYSFIVILGAILAAVCAGINSKRRIRRHSVDIVMPIMICAVAWPILVPCVIIAAPFVGLYYLGRLIADRL